MTENRLWDAGRFIQTFAPFRGDSSAGASGCSGSRHDNTTDLLEERDGSSIGSWGDGGKRSSVQQMVERSYQVRALSEMPIRHGRYSVMTWN